MMPPVADDFDPTPLPSTGEPERPWPRQRHFNISYHDIDVLQHLNHAAYLPFMETLRCDYYLSLIGTTNPKDLDIIIAEATCRYRRPVSYGEDLIGEVAPALPLGRTSFTLLYRFRTAIGSKITARGRTVVVCFDYAKGTKKEIPAHSRSVMEGDGVLPASEGWV